MRFLRFLAFALYLFFLISIPLGLFWEWQGWLAGTVVWCIGLLFLGIRAKPRLLQALNSTPLTTAENHRLHRLNREISARLGMPVPQIEKIPGKVPLVAAFGFSPSDMVIVVSEEVLTLSRTEWHSLFCRVLTEIRFGDRISRAWLARFCVALERFGLNTSFGESLVTSKGILRRAAFFVLAWVPYRLLMGDHDERKWDEMSLRLSQAREPYIELLHRFESSLARKPIGIPFALKPLFLFAPESEDPWLAVFSGQESLSQRIRQRIQWLSAE